jgi:tRNA 5-methylaminomethyl-2-thiouridine biosynthesis bifunctional protein
VERHAIVIGAGLAGSSAAERLAARGWRISLIDRLAAPGEGASGNRAGVLRPLPSLDDNHLARLTRAAFAYALTHLQALTAAGLPLRWGQTGVLHLARDERHASAQQRIVAAQAPPAGYLRWLDREAASELAGWPVACGGWWFAGGGWVDPASLCRANLARHGAAVQPHYRRQVGRIEREGGCWRCFAGDGELIAAAPVLVLANAGDARHFAAASHLPLRPARGQVSHLPAVAGSPPEIVVCRLGYVTPAIDGLRCAGASFAVDDDETELRAADHADNLARLDFILPGYGRQSDPATLAGRVGFRPLSPDRLPMVGAVADATAADAASPAASLGELRRVPGLYVSNGFGARGIVWSALAGELLACLVAGSPPPITADLVAAVDPGRFLLRGRRQRRAAGGPR